MAGAPITAATHYILLLVRDWAIGLWISSIHAEITSPSRCAMLPAYASALILLAIVRNWIARLLFLAWLLWFRPVASTLLLAPRRCFELWEASNATEGRLFSQDNRVLRLEKLGDSVYLANETDFLTAIPFMTEDILMAHFERHSVQETFISSGTLVYQGGLLLNAPILPATWSHSWQEGEKLRKRR